MRITVALLLAFCFSLAAFAEDKPLRIVLVGDSTVAKESGWGPGFTQYVGPGAEVINWARGGRSSKSFINEGWWKKALADKPDYVLIQFGHNDQPGKGPERETDPKTTFPQWMAKYVDEARSAGAKPILITSLTRRTFGPDGKIRDTLGDYADATARLAKEKNVPLIDLHALSIAQCEAMGPEKCKVFDPTPKSTAAETGQPKGPDHTHLSPEGSRIIGRLVADELAKVAPDLAKYVKKD